jgi:putative ABC transport system permease protein
MATFGVSLKVSVLAEFDILKREVLYITTGDEEEDYVRITNLPVFTLNDVNCIRNLSRISMTAPLKVYDSIAVNLSVPETTPPTQTEDKEPKLQVLPHGLTVSTQNLFDIFGYELNGSVFRDETEIVIGSAIATEFGLYLYNRTLDIGDNITLFLIDKNEFRTFRISGVLKYLKTYPQVGFNPNIWVVTNISLFSEKLYTAIVATATSAEEIKDAKNDVLQYLTQKSDAMKNTNEEFLVLTQDTIIQIIESIMTRIEAFIIGIAAVSLIVGGIGITSVMLASAVERTSEIGLLRAIGARKKDIMQMFILESLFIGLIGAVIGAVIGLFAAYVLVTISDFQLVYPIIWYPIAIIVGMIVGIVAGIFPAKRAASVDPVIALRQQ